jgi:hypothetical protein
MNTYKTPSIYSINDDLNTLTLGPISQSSTQQIARHSLINSHSAVVPEKSKKIMLQDIKSILKKLVRKHKIKKKHMKKILAALTQ